MDGAGGRIVIILSPVSPGDSKSEGLLFLFEVNERNSLASSIRMLKLRNVS